MLEEKVEKEMLFFVCVTFSVRSFVCFYNYSLYSILVLTFL